MMQAEILRGIAALDLVEDDWRGLTAAFKDGPYYVQFAVVRAAVECLVTDGADVIIIRVRDAKGCAALLRLSTLSRRILRTLSLRTLEITRFPECPHQDLLMRPDASATEVWKAMARALHEAKLDWDAIGCRSVPRWQGLHRFVDQLGSRVRVTKGAGSSLAENRIGTERSYAEVAAAFSPQLQKNLAKGWRRIERMGDWEVLSVRGSPDQLWAFDEFCRIEASGWKGSQGLGSAVGLNSRTREYFRRLFLIDDGLSVWSEINLLRVMGTAIAAQFCMNSGGTKAVIKVGYDEAHARLGPGQLLLDQTVRRSCADPAIETVSLVSSQLWHTDWGVQGRAVDDILLLRSLTLGLIWQSFVRVRSASSRTEK